MTLTAVWGRVVIRKGGTELRSIFIEFPEESEPWGVVHFSDEDTNYAYNCRGKIGQQYPPQVRLRPSRQRKSRFFNSGTNETWAMAIGPLDQNGQIFIHEGIAEEFHSTGGSIILNRWDMKKLFLHFDRQLILAIKYPW